MVCLLTFVTSDFECDSSTITMSIFAKLLSERRTFQVIFFISAVCRWMLLSFLSPHEKIVGHSKQLGNSSCEIRCFSNISFFCDWRSFKTVRWVFFVSYWNSIQGRLCYFFLGMTFTKLELIVPPSRCTYFYNLLLI